MRVSKFPLSTLKETPADAEIISHQLMLRAGLIRRLASGLYTWLPLGLKVLRKVEKIVREEMEHSHGLEILMPAVQPSELWKESGRWEQYGAELLRMNDRHGREFCFGPTHEEIITDLARRELSSYKQLPITYYQIQTKFRDERRPRFGVMRAREFLMKDAYSFHADQACLDTTYIDMYDTYNRIFNRLNLNFRPVQADSGSIGGTGSHEFHVLADSGEDALAVSDQSDYAANVEKAEAIAPAIPRADAVQELQTIDTPNQKSIAEVSAFLNVGAKLCLKTLLVEGAEENQVIALVLRGDHEVNDIKVEHLPQIAEPFTLVSDEVAEKVAGCKPGSIGPVGLDITIIADHAALTVNDFVCGANADDKHLTGVNWGRDLPEAIAADIRNVVTGDPSPDGKGTLSIVRGIEVGHIFKLGKKYSEALKATVLDQNGKAQIMTMGCYGIGVSRIVASAIEQNNDENGIVWPESIAPFDIAIAPINLQKSEALQTACDKLYSDLTAAGYDVLYFDAKGRLGGMLADIELIGIPHRLVIGDRGLESGTIEYKGRRDEEKQEITLDSVLDFIEQQRKK